MSWTLIDPRVPDAEVAAPRIGVTDMESKAKSVGADIAPRFEPCRPAHPDLRAADRGHEPLPARAARARPTAAADCDPALLPVPAGVRSAAAAYAADFLVLDHRRRHQSGPSGPGQNGLPGRRADQPALAALPAARSGAGEPGAAALEVSTTLASTSQVG